VQVILRQDVDKVGLRGEVVDVAPGFARNFLLPRKLAEKATPGRVAEIEKVEAARARHEAQDFEQAQQLAQQLEAEELRFDMPAGPTGTLFGSVTATNIADEVWDKRRIRVDRRKIELAESIKRIGRYQVPVELFTDVTATLRVAVAPEGGDLPPEEELRAAEDAEAAATAEDEARAAAEHEAAEEAVAAVAAEEEVEPSPEAAADQVPADAFDRAVDAAVPDVSREDQQA
jgi:large subunit ribosomal protein L9